MDLAIKDEKSIGAEGYLHVSFESTLIYLQSFKLILELIKLELIEIYFRAVIPCYYRGCHVMHDGQVSCVFLSSMLVGSQHCLYSALIMVWETHQED